MNKSPVCLDLEPDLVAAAAGEAEAATAHRVHAHVERCRPCREDFERYQAIEGEVSAMRSHLLAAPHVTRARAELESRLADLRSRLVAYRVFASPVGHVLIARSEQGVLLLEYLGRRHGPGASRLRRLPGVELVEEGDDVDALYGELREYLEGRRTHLDWPLDLRLVQSDFHRAVLQATAAIPYGAVVSYAGLAREIGRPRAVRAAAQALRWNPLPIVIPCHRVVGSSGALTGYAGGEATKRKLLEVEGIPIERAHHDVHIVRDAMYVLAPGDAEYCLPTCPSVDPFPLGGRLFGSRARAEAVGLAPCTTCRPDLHPLAR
ncbi:MAG: methylated-DNA--[protein]-cysteine S-methyltransferase [Candidatus Rokubacteria bacterium]|nr:methylated-DNA--[protein]-cysteine S-methyltransferase [Candidatus Rokubacteria bacterium]